MKHETKLGSRIAEVHNGSSLFTGDAGQGESNIRRWIIENDWLEAIVALPLNMFYNTGIATYIWVLTNRKPEHRSGKVQLIDATQVVQAAAQEPRQEELRALRRGHRAHLRHVPRLRGDRAVEDLPERALRLPEGDRRAAAAPARHRPERVYSAKEIKALKETAERDEDAPPSSRRSTSAAPRPIRCAACSRRRSTARPCVVEYEPDPDLRDTEQVPLLEEGGIEAFLEREVLPYAPDAWYDPASVKIGYEISFTRYFYKPQPLRSLEEIRADILALEQETEGLARRDRRGTPRDCELRAVSRLRRTAAFRGSERCRSIGSVLPASSVLSRARAVRSRNADELSCSRCSYGQSCVKSRRTSCMVLVPEHRTLSETRARGRPHRSARRSCRALEQRVRRRHDHGIITSGVHRVSEPSRVDARATGYSSSCMSYDRRSEDALTGIGLRSTAEPLTRRTSSDLRCLLPPCRARRHRPLPRPRRPADPALHPRQAEADHAAERAEAGLIHRAVTRGLDPNVRLKPSGVEWLGTCRSTGMFVASKNVLRSSTSGPRRAPRRFYRSDASTGSSISPITLVTASAGRDAPSGTSSLRRRRSS